jgi:RNA polymerase sigma factor (TIGR02999 family)
MEHGSRIDGLLTECRSGKGEAFDQLVSLIYDDLRAVAHRQLKKHKRPQTLSTTGLVHETYLKLTNQSTMSWQDKAHFLSIAALAMRQVIVDYAKRMRAQKRGRDLSHQPLDSINHNPSLSVTQQAEEIVALDQALARLAAHDQRLVKIVECRCFAGYTLTETAEILAVSTKTVQRDWLKARAWLREMGWAGSRA